MLGLCFGLGRSSRGYESSTHGQEVISRATDPPPAARASFVHMLLLQECRRCGSKVTPVDFLCPRFRLIHEGEVLQPKMDF